MAQQKWIKWIVGMAGVAMFSGFVGILSHGAQANESPANASSGSDGGSIAQNDDDVTGQWQNQLGGGQGGSGNDGSMNGGSDIFGGIDNGNGNGNQSEFHGRGGMRTHAS